MLSRKISFCLLYLTFLALGCRTTPKDQSQVKEAPGPVNQGAPFPVNLCDAGGIKDAPEGQGWKFDPRMGCRLLCRDKDAVRSDFMGQLRRHRIYGDPDLIAETDPAGAAIARYYQERQAKRGLNARFLADIKEDKIFESTRDQVKQLRVGDILVFMTFGTPNRAGAFYSKRGIPHAVIVSHVDQEKGISYIVLEGGSGITKHRGVNTQAIWLRPRPEFFKEADMKDVAAWSKLFAPLEYDNLLIDDIQTFRAQLHARLDQGMRQEQALAETWNASEKEKFSPQGKASSFKFQQASGHYCSEGVADMFSYLGFRQYGDTPIELVTAFNPEGNLPDWEIYLSALEGFDANRGAALVMYRTFWNYFKTFDTARKLGLISIPGLNNPRDSSFGTAIEANLKAVEKDGGVSDHLAKQLDQMLIQLEKMPEQAALAKQTKELKIDLQKTADQMSKVRRQAINISQAAYSIFQANTIYGPHTFLENPKYFDFKGVFFNLSQRGHARYAADLEIEGPTPDDVEVINVSTTLYILTMDKTMPADRCIIAEREEPVTVEQIFEEPPYF